MCFRMCKSREKENIINIFSRHEAIFVPKQKEPQGSPSSLSTPDDRDSIIRSIANSSIMTMPRFLVVENTSAPAFPCPDIVFRYHVPYYNTATPTTAAKPITKALAPDPLSFVAAPVYCAMSPFVYAAMSPLVVVTTTGVPVAGIAVYGVSSTVSYTQSSQSHPASAPHELDGLGAALKFPSSPAVTKAVVVVPTVATTDTGLEDGTEGVLPAAGNPNVLILLKVW